MKPVNNGRSGSYWGNGGILAIYTNNRPLFKYQDSTVHQILVWSFCTISHWFIQLSNFYCTISRLGLHKLHLGLHEIGWTAAYNKAWELGGILAVFSLRMSLWASGRNSDTGIRFPDSSCIIEAICGDFMTFAVVVFNGYSRCVICFTPHDNRFEVDMITRYVTSFLLLVCYVTLYSWPLTFWPWSVVIYGGLRDQHLHQFEDLLSILSRVASYDC